MTPTRPGLSDATPADAALAAAIPAAAAPPVYQTIHVAALTAALFDHLLTDMAAQGYAYVNVATDPNPAPGEVPHHVVFRWISG